MAGAASSLKAPKPFQPALVKGLAPSPDRIVVQIKRLRDPHADTAVVKQQNGVGSPRQALLRMPVSQQRSQIRAQAGRKKPAANHPTYRIQKPQSRKPFFRPLNESGYWSVLCPDFSAGWAP